MTITAITSFIIGLYVVYNRGKIVKKISDYMENNKTEVMQFLA
jgi:hydrogenase-4 membrane subunit HyfE